MGHKRKEDKPEDHGCMSHTQPCEHQGLVPRQKNQQHVNRNKLLGRRIVGMMWVWSHGLQPAITQIRNQSGFVELSAMRTCSAKSSTISLSFFCCDRMEVRFLVLPSAPPCRFGLPCRARSPRISDLAFLLVITGVCDAEVERGDAVGATSMWNSASQQRHGFDMKWTPRPTFPAQQSFTF